MKPFLDSLVLSPVSLMHTVLTFVTASLQCLFMLMEIARGGTKSYFSFFFFFSFLMWTNFKVFIEFVIILLCFMFWYFGPKAYGILAPPPRIKPVPPALKVKF